LYDYAWMNKFNFKEDDLECILHWSLVGVMVVLC